MTPRQRRVAIVVPVVCLLLVVALRLWLEWVGPIPGDRWALTRNDFGHQSPVVLDLGNFFQVAGTPAVAVVTVVWMAVFVYRAEGTRGILFLILAGVGAIANSVAKVISGPTPLMVTGRASHDLNFPSGHTVFAAVVFGAVAWMAFRRRRFDIAAGLMFFVMLMGPFRVTLGAHFASDVVAGYLVGLAWLVPVAVVTGFGSARLAEQST